MPNLCNTVRLQSSNLGQSGLCKALIVLSSFHKCIAALNFCSAHRMKRSVINVHRSLGRRLAALLVCELSGTDIFPSAFTASESPSCVPASSHPVQEAPSLKACKVFPVMHACLRWIG